MEERLELILPEEGHEASVMQYKQEFQILRESVDGGARLDSKKTFEEWLLQARDRRTEEFAAKNGWVPATVFLAVKKDTKELAGMVDIRHRLNDELFIHGGHIGYSVRPVQRRMGYGTEILKLALKECRKLGLDRVLVTCSKTNIGSAKIIGNNGGVLENELQDGDRVTQRYWIGL